MEETITDKKRTAKERAKQIFSSKNIARMAVFTALSYILYMPIFEFSIIPTVSFLKIDFSNTFVMMAGFALGPIAGIIVGVLKELLHAVTFSQTVGVGELANIIIMLPYVLIPSIVYKKHRNIKAVLITLAIAVLVQSAWSFPVNYLLTFPFFMSAFGGSWTGGMQFYLDVWYWAVLFNLVKTLLVSAGVLLLYKQFQKLFNYIFNKDRRKAAAAVSTAEHTVGTEECVLPNGGAPKTFDVSSPSDMEGLGEQIGRELAGGDVVLLSGELGAGKTVFCKGLCKGLGIVADVSSPTFTLMNEYVGDGKKLCHIDAYRLSGSDEAYAAGICEYIAREDCVCAVEWWENMSDSFDGVNAVKVNIEKCDDNIDARKVTVQR